VLAGIAQEQHKKGISSEMLADVRPSTETSCNENRYAPMLQ